MSGNGAIPCNERNFESTFSNYPSKTGILNLRFFKLFPPSSAAVFEGADRMETMSTGIQSTMKREYALEIADFS